jgi:hypothetical protein
VEPQIAGDSLLMLGDLRLPFAVEFNQPCMKPRLRRAEANQFLQELEGLLLREAVEEPVPSCSGWACCSRGIIAKNGLSGWGWHSH